VAQQNYHYPKNYLINSVLLNSSDETDAGKAGPTIELHEEQQKNAWDFDGLMLSRSPVARKEC
jgi:hypothetical protein